jgi:CRP-like cAMP-binding protein
LVLVHSGPYLLQQIGEKLGRYRGEQVVGRVYLEKGDPVYDIGDPAFSFYLIEKGQVALADEHGPVRTLKPGQHFCERELLQNLKRQFNATTLLALNKATFEALAQNSLALGYLLSRSAVEYLMLEERKAIVDRISAALRDHAHGRFHAGRSDRGSRDGFGGLCAENVQQAAASRCRSSMRLNGAKAGYAWGSSLTCCTRARRASSRRSIIC